MLVLYEKAIVIWILNTFIASCRIQTSVIILAPSLENKIWILTTFCFFHSQNLKLELLFCFPRAQKSYQVERRMANKYIRKQLHLTKRHSCKRIQKEKEKRKRLHCNKCLYILKQPKWNPLKQYFLADFCHHSWSRKTGRCDL